MKINIFNGFLKKENFERDLFFDVNTAKDTIKTKGTISTDGKTGKVLKFGNFFIDYECLSIDSEQRKFTYSSTYFCNYEIKEDEIPETKKVILYLSNSVLENVKKIAIKTINDGGIVLEEINGNLTQ